ncbi:TRAP transporter small permease [Pseudooceanicola sp.]|jgi:TRAP-type C4-dicarboxylate transport system permease small subunit|uniref:TRAP transporter small permease n=1 Tax=Pseudooceanicola sp. TaxID=1914328 RepID=UPI004059E5C1
MRRIERLSAGLDRVCLALAKAGLIGIALVILLQVAQRYGVRAPFAWTEELARYLMVWSGLLGATCAFRRGMDPVILSVTADAPPRRQWLARGMLALCVVIFLLPMLHYSIFGPGWNVERGFLWRGMGRTSPGLGLNMALVGAVIPITCLTILIHCAARVTASLPSPKGTPA